MATVEFYGETFNLTGAVSEFALLEFADAAAEGQDGDTMQGMASLLRLVRECVEPAEWTRFRGLARKNKATSADLLPVIQAAFEQASERPTGRPSDSSDGPKSIPPSSESNAADKGLAELDGRPDLKLAIMRSRESAAS